MPTPHPDQHHHSPTRRSGSHTPTTVAPYTRADAIADALLFEVPIRLSRLFGFTYPVAVTAQVALVHDEETMWAWQAQHLLTDHIDYDAVVMAWHAALTRAHGVIDVVPVTARLGAEGDTGEGGRGEPDGGRGFRRTAAGLAMRRQGRHLLLPCTAYRVSCRVRAVSLTEGLPYGPDVHWRRPYGSIHPGGAGGSPAPGAWGQCRTRRGGPCGRCRPRGGGLPERGR